MGAEHRMSKLEDQYPNHFATDANIGETQPSKNKGEMTKNSLLIC